MWACISPYCVNVWAVEFGPSLLGDLTNLAGRVGLWLAVGSDGKSCPLVRLYWWARRYGDTVCVMYSV